MILGTGVPVPYPEFMIAAGIGGVVTLRLVVVPGDSVSLDRVTILSSPHPRFTSAARETVRHLPVRAAIRDGLPVVDSFELDLQYDQRWEGSFPPLIDTTVMELPTRDGAGRWKARISVVALKPSSLPLSRPMHDSAAIAAVRYLGEGKVRGTPNGAPIICVTLRQGRESDPLTPDEWRAVQTPGAAMLHPSRCPPKFASMVLIEGRVIPPGVDPFHLVVTGVEGVEGGWIVVRISLGQGTSGDYYACVLRQSLPSQVVRCRSDRSWVS